jgi:hypothetical protein
MYLQEIKCFPITPFLVCPTYNFPMKNIKGGKYYMSLQTDNCPMFLGKTNRFRLLFKKLQGQEHLCFLAFFIEERSDA